MVIDNVTAQEISQIAISLGLPLGKEEDLILALTGVDLNISSEEEAAKIWRTAQLPEESQSFLQEEDAINWVQTEVLPGVKNYINGKIQAKTIPYGYPFTDELLQRVYPSMNTQSLQLMASGWEVQRWNAIKFLALCEIWKLADTTNEDYRNKGNDLCKQGEKYLEGLITALTEVLQQLPDNTSQGKVGVLVIKLRKNKRYSGNEYSNS